MSGSLSPCDGMYGCTDWTSVYTLIRTSWAGRGGGGFRANVNSKGEKNPLFLRGGSNLRRCLLAGEYPVCPCRLNDLVVKAFASKAGDPGIASRFDLVESYFKHVLSN